MLELTDAWLKLEKKAQPGSTLDQLRLFGDRPLSLFAILATADRQVGIQLEVDAASVPALGAFPSPGAFQTKTEKVDKHTRISVLLTRNEFRDVFAEMCSDLLTACLESADENSAVRALHSRLHTWRELFSGAGPRPLTEAEQVGLFGELTFLERVLNAGLAASAAIASWQGPKRHHHDFHFGRIHLEVKTTESNSMSASISSIAQLDPVGLERLFLWQYEVAEASHGGRTLATLVELIRSRFKGVDLLAFNRLLIAARYLAAHVAHYETTLLEVLAERAFVVDDNFPSLKRSNVPASVTEAKYICDLGKVPDVCATSTDEALKAIVLPANPS